MFGYSCGANFLFWEKEIKPKIRDVIVISLIWGLSIYVFDNIQKYWLFILIFLFSAGLSTLLFRFTPTAQIKTNAEIENPLRTNNSTKKRVSIFFQQVGEFQSRLLLTYVYMLVISPFGLLQRVFSDKLSLRRKIKTYGWIDRKTGGTTLKENRRQY